MLSLSPYLTNHIISHSLLVHSDFIQIMVFGVCHQPASQIIWQQVDMLGKSEQQETQIPEPMTKTSSYCSIVCSF